MDIFHIDDMKDRWYAGYFEPTAYRTDKFEVCHKIHPKGEEWATHYHKEGTEINLLINGEMILQGELLKGGDIFIIKPYEIADPEFLTDCELVVIKTPSKPGDKFEVIEKPEAITMPHVYGPKDD